MFGKSPSLAWRLRAAATFCCLLILANSPFLMRVLAQETAGPEQWTPPVNLAANFEGQGFFPSVTSDAAGGVHVFWDQNETTAGGTITWVNYAYWNGETWSPPVDVFIGRAGPSASSAKAVVDDQGIMHTIWLDSGVLMYARRHVSSPLAARSWTGQQELGFTSNGGIGPAALTLDDQGGIHVAYLQRGTQSGVYYSRSLDGGNIWDPPVLLSDNSQQIDSGPGDPYSLDLLTVGNSVHVVWTQREEDTSLGYAKSVDRGLSWLGPRLLPGGNWPLLVALDDGQLSILSTGGLPGDSRICLKQQMRSPDQGDTWDRPLEILQPDIKGCLGRMNVVRDNTGEQYLITSAYKDLSYDVARIWRSSWNGDGWNTPITVSWPATPYQNLGTQPDFPTAAVSLGNVVHVVFHTTEGDIWYSQATLPGAPDDRVVFAPAGETANGETSPSAEESPVLPGEFQVTASASVQQPTSLPAGSTVQTNTGPQVDPLLAGSLTAAVLVAVVLYLNLANRRRAR